MDDVFLLAELRFLHEGGDVIRGDSGGVFDGETNLFRMRHDYGFVCGRLEDARYR